MIDIPRVIPVLLLQNGGLYKTVNFKKPKYVGDPVNAVKVFNEKEVDEIILLDIAATRENKEPDYTLLAEIAGECFMPLCYGGGIGNIEQIRRIISIGVEKVSLNTEAVRKPEFVREAADAFGSSTIVVSIDVVRSRKKQFEVVINGGTKATGRNAVELAVEMNKYGAGELLLNSVDRDGMMNGYDLELLSAVASSVDIPVIICGGAGNLSHFSEAIKDAKASAVAAGSLFVFHGKNRGVLINYPGSKEIQELFS